MKRSIAYRNPRLLIWSDVLCLHRRIDYGYSDDETFEEVYEHWYAQYDRFEGEDDSWKYCIIKEKPCSLRSPTASPYGLEQVFEEMDEEERWKQESQLMTKDSNATAVIHTASISDVFSNKAPQGRIIAITKHHPLHADSTVTNSTSISLSLPDKKIVRGLESGL